MLVPNGVVSAKLKLARAKALLREIERAVAAYANSQPHKISRAEKKRKKLTVNIPPPNEISVIAGEMIHQMRSALDHLAYELVKKHSNATEDWLRASQFPIQDAAPKNGKFGSLPGISDEAFKAIDGMQPYRGPDGLHAAHGCLRVLRELSNIDKHRRLNLTRPRVRCAYSIRFASGREVGGWQVLDPGVIIELPRPEGETDRRAYVRRRYRTLVAFDEADRIGPINDWPLDLLLSLILYQIEVFVVPALQRLIELP